MTSLIMGWVLPHQPLIYKIPHRLPYRPIWWRHFLSWDGLFPVDSDPNLPSIRIYFISSNIALEDILNMSIRMFAIITHFLITTNSSIKRRSLWVKLLVFTTKNGKFTNLLFNVWCCLTRSVCSQGNGFGYIS